MDASAPSALAQEEIKQAVEDAKPGPKPNLQATTVAEVYPVEEVVGLDALRGLTVRDWQDKVKDGDDILTKSRYVSGRVREVVKSEQVRKIKALKYLLLLVEWYHCFKPGPKGVKKLGPRKEVEQAMKDTSEEMRNGIRERFAEGTYAIALFAGSCRVMLIVLLLAHSTNGTRPTFIYTSAPSHSSSTTSPLMFTTFAKTFASSLASTSLFQSSASPYPSFFLFPFRQFFTPALSIPYRLSPILFLPSSSPTNFLCHSFPIRIHTLFMHLGSTISAPTAAHLDRLSLTKAQATGHRIAHLALPLNFPQPRTFRPKGGRR